MTVITGKINKYTMELINSFFSLPQIGNWASSESSYFSLLEWSLAFKYTVGFPLKILMVQERAGAEIEIGFKGLCLRTRGSSWILT